jgi:hypothetical protein
MLAPRMRLLHVAQSRPVLAVVLAQLPVFVTLGMLRTADADEGFYLLASRLVNEGRLPYIDFMYIQMPLVPYVYGVWMKLFGLSWYAGRLLSALLATALGTLIFSYAVRTFRNPSLAWMGVSLYLLSAFVLAWNTVVMTYALSGLLLFAAFFVLHAWPKVFASTRFLASGFLLGLAIDSRLLLVPAIAAFLIGLRKLDGGERSTVRRSAEWLVGLVVGLAPSVFFVLVDAQAFIFGNLSFHALRNGSGLVGAWPQKGAMLAELLNIRSAGGESIAFQVPLLLGLNAYYIVLIVRRRASITIAFTASVLIAAALLLPTPTYSQYFVVIVPFVIVNALFALDALRREIGKAGVPTAIRDHLRIACGVFLAGYGLVVPIVIYKYVSWIGPAVPGLHQVDPRDWSLPNIRRVSSAVDQFSGRGTQVLVWWPGYLLETQALPVAGMENHGWMEIGNAGHGRVRPKIASPSTVEAALTRREPRLVVLGLLAPKRYRDVALADGYVVADQVAGVDLLKSPE